MCENNVQHINKLVASFFKTQHVRHSRVTTFLGIKLKLFKQKPDPDQLNIILFNRIIDLTESK